MVNQIKDVQPITDKQQLEDMEHALIEFCGERDRILFLMGVFTGLRCGDMLNLKTKQIITLKNKREKSLKVKEGKTQKTRIIYLDTMWNDLYKYASTVDSEWLFPSRKGDKPISVTQAYRQLNKAAFFADIEHVGTHTMRKTFGYWFYKQEKDIAKLQGILNHSTPQVTMRYIGITEEETRESLKHFNPFA